MGAAAVGMFAVGLGKASATYAGAIGRAEDERLNAKAYELQGEWDAKANERNARLSELDAVDTETAGNRAGANAFKEGRRVQGAQRAGFAAGGVDVNSGSAADVQADTQTLSALDVLTIKNNASREAYGLRTQSRGYSSAAEHSRYMGQSAAYGARSRARQTLLAGGISALDNITSSVKSGMEMA